MSNSVPDDSYTLLISFFIKEAQIEPFQKAGRAIAEKVQQEKECISFEFLQDAMDPTRFFVIEKWNCSLEHLLEVQLKRAYYVPYVEETEPMWSQPRQAQFLKTKLSYP